MASSPRGPLSPLDGARGDPASGLDPVHAVVLSVEDYVGSIEEAGGAGAGALVRESVCHIFGRRGRHLAFQSSAGRSTRSSELPRLSCKAWLIAHLKSGEVLAHCNALQDRQIASITKLVTAWVVTQVLDAVPELRTARVQVSAEASSVTGTSAELREGETYTVLELLHGMLLPSGNDAATALAEYFGPLFASTTSALHAPPSPSSPQPPASVCKSAWRAAEAVSGAPPRLTFPAVSDHRSANARRVGSPAGGQRSVCSSPATWAMSEGGADEDEDEEDADVVVEGAAQSDSDGAEGAFEGLRTSGSRPLLRLAAREPVGAAARGGPSKNAGGGAGSPGAPAMSRHLSAPSGRPGTPQGVHGAQQAVRMARCEAVGDVASDDDRSRHTASPAVSVATAPSPVLTSRRRGASDPPLVTSMGGGAASGWALGSTSATAASVVAAAVGTRAGAVGAGRLPRLLSLRRTTLSRGAVATGAPSSLSPTALVAEPSSFLSWGDCSVPPASCPASAAAPAARVGGIDVGGAWLCAPLVAESVGGGGLGGAAGAGAGEDKGRAVGEPVTATSTLSAAHALLAMAWDGFPPAPPAAVSTGRSSRSRSRRERSAGRPSRQRDLSPLSLHTGAAGAGACPPAGMVTSAASVRVAAAAVEKLGGAAGCAWFVARMNEEARRLGMRRTRFVNPHGLAEDGHRSCAADVARLAARVWRHPLLRRVCGTKRLQCRVPWSKGLPLAGYPRQLAWRNSNRLLWRSQSGCVYSGIKTGITPVAMGCLVTAVQRSIRANSTALLVVVLGSAGPHERFVDTDRLAQWAMEAIPDRTVIQQLMSRSRRRGRRHREGGEEADAAFVATTPTSEPGGGGWFERRSTRSPRARVGRHRARACRESRGQAGAGVGADAGVGRQAAGDGRAESAVVAPGAWLVSATGAMEAPRGQSAGMGRSPSALPAVAETAATPPLPTLVPSIPVDATTPPGAMDAVLPASGSRANERVVCGDVLGRGLAVPARPADTRVVPGEVRSRPGNRASGAPASSPGGRARVTVWELQSSPSPATPGERDRMRGGWT